MTSMSLKPRRVSVKPAFVKGHDKDRTPPGYLPEPFESNDKPRRASLDQYRNEIHNSVSKDLDDMEKEMLTTLEDLTTELDDHIKRLSKVEEPLQKPFDTETLSTWTYPPGDHSEGKHQEVLLQVRMANFRKLREGKEKTLCRLWEEWEDIQFELIGLAAEVLGPDLMTFAQSRDEDMKPGQKGRLENALRPAQSRRHEQDDQHESLEQDLEALQEQMNQISTKTKRTVTEMQQQYTVQKNKLFKGLHRHIELLAAL
ncbi:hypothetical protein LTR10_019789 [Elasticomyces elasticus]|uniref:Uncharacterized protein n=1 Tax=Exophiala sideris TaxID=1016849 RepID=A0ABR0JCI4_9EURO|nr:hypothetical protein LTR10_019789 [Elasticomyces elasticus]KAK5032083.1 hypothetical protein LTS07_004705 [Exophiala sideris]KAK5041010.1 hypothetical protein LTR13_003312 [Exophiala sideris]KAK5061656.1 hypothetical protein LTR69_004838 [Exophiala sideris]KAK5184355.1 hypothetical protein LTR44_003028 [Eurotiomycetes sp. CCFEE 6388]